jgi:hypothetical protein
MLPVVDFCGLNASRLMIGGNPFSGFSHQSSERDQEMLDYYSVANIKLALRRAEEAGINTAVMRSDNHIHRLLREYYNEGGAIQWIAQLGYDGDEATIGRGIASAVAAGAKAGYIHGGITDRCYADSNLSKLADYVAMIQDHGIPGGIAGHAAEAHLWAYEQGLAADFHVVCFYNCGSLHDGKGDKFNPEDPPVACEVIRQIEKPCIGYKVLGAGRVEPQSAFEFAFANIKPTDCVNVGVYLGDNENMIEENAALVAEITNRI